METPAQQPQPVATPRPARIARWLGKRLLVLAAIVVIFRLSGCMERLFYHPTAGPTPPPPQLRGAELVTFASGDGTRLTGWFIPASPLTRQPGDQPAATILHVHGNAGNMNDHIWFTQQLPFAGFNLFIFDYRGYGQSEGRATKRGPLLADTNAALDYVLSRPDVDPLRVGMYGQSLGGAIGLNVMADRPEIRCAVIESAFSSWRDVAASTVGGEHPGWWARTLAGLLIADDDRVDDVLRRIDRPILLLHGDADTTVPITHSRMLKAAGGSNVELIEFAGGVHNSLRESHPDMERIVIEFYQRNLAANANP